MSVVTDVNTDTLAMTSSVTDYTLVADSLSADQVTLTENTITQNYCGSSRSVLQVEGFSKVSMLNNVIEENENMLAESYKTGILYATQSDQSFPEEVTSIELVEHRCKSIVHIRAAYTVALEGDSYNANTVIDSFTPYATSSRDAQANAIMIEDMNGGTLSFINMFFTKHQGTQNLKTPNSLSDTVFGFQSRVITFLNMKVDAIEMDGMEFTNNHGSFQVQHNWARQKPQLFNIN